MEKKETTPKEEVAKTELTVEEAQKFLQQENQKKCDLVAKKFNELLKEHGVDAIPCVTIAGQVIDVQNLINAQVGLRFVVK